MSGIRHKKRTSGAHTSGPPAVDVTAATPEVFPAS
jgi:hypothetical protein